VPARLADLIRAGRLAPRERADAGDTLARLGDPRFRPDAWYLPAELLLGFVEVPEGEFIMGSDPARDPGALPEEQPQHPVQLPGYFIGRYPVTVAQFAAFVEASNYQPSDPTWLRDPANRPVVWVAFDDALAYCDWLGKTLHDWDETPEPLAGLLRGGGYHITLPSETEWERAARDTDGRLYPWGDDPPEPRHANYRDTGIGGMSPVGSFPDGASACGCLDMAGNCWEWTRNVWGRSFDKPDFGYSNASGDGLENLAAACNTPRVLRGGAFYDVVSFLRCAVRDRHRHFPDPRYWLVGFRVVVSPSISEL
jgi:formylglycine-generating enzyme required for sulfatase activity